MKGKWFLLVFMVSLAVGFFGSKIYRSLSDPYDSRVVWSQSTFGEKDVNGITLWHIFVEVTDEELAAVGLSRDSRTVEMIHDKPHLRSDTYAKYRDQINAVP